jgi:hypothetical protein
MIVTIRGILIAAKELLTIPQIIIDIKIKLLPGMAGTTAPIIPTNITATKSK